MTITATILDANECPISDGIAIENDDFSAAEQAARDFADQGIKCCIRWHRSSDGQTAFWAPVGASFDPYWYGG